MPSAGGLRPGGTVTSHVSHSKNQINYGKTAVFCDESGTKGYADQSEKEPGESVSLPASPFGVMKSADR
jgi:hypothetical protein